MSNPLTGGFDAAVQLAVRQINGLLAALHQRGADAGTALKLLHSERARIGDPRIGPPDMPVFGEWVVAYEEAQPAGPRPPARDRLIGVSPPGLAQRFVEAYSDRTVLPPPLPPGSVRGTATLQISTLRLGVPEGSTSHLHVHANLRALYEPDPDTTPLPAPAYGEVRAVYEIGTETAGATRRLRIRPAPTDGQVTFSPATGTNLSGTDAALIAAQIGTVLREGITLLPVELPVGFPFTGFKGVGSGPTAAVALPLQLSNAPPPPGGLQAITQPFIGSSGFGLAVSREHVARQIDIESIRAAIRQRTITVHVGVWPLSGQVTYRLRFSSGPTLTFKPAAVEIAGRVEVETSTWWAPNGFVSFVQLVALTLDPVTQRVDLVAAGDPAVEKSWFIPHGTAVSAVRAEMARALDANGPAVRQLFLQARTTVVDALRAFEPSAGAAYTHVEISPHGVVIRGEVSSASRIPPVVHVDDAGDAFTAFRSWIPGGWIEQFTWSWVEYPPPAPLQPTPWSGVAKSVTATHGFLLDKPPGVALDRVCLRVTGSRFLPDGTAQGVAAGTICEIADSVLAFEAPSWWEPVTVPVWMPDVPEAVPLRDAVAAHLSLQIDRPRRELGQNVLVLFSDLDFRAPLEVLVRGLQRMRRREAAPAILIVAPAGVFDRPRRDLDSLLAVVPPGVAGGVQVAEDIAGGWTRTFDVRAMPSVFLVNARREVVRAAAGEIDPAAVATALDERLLAAPAPRFRPLRLRVAVGDPAPDVVFRDDRGMEGALHRLRGRTVLLAFWQAWSAPSLAELRRLQQLQEADPREAPVVVALHGGPAPEGFDAIRREHGMSFPLVQDREQAVARRFGVRCWPTTVAIGPGGVIEHIQLGVSHEAPGQRPAVSARPPTASGAWDMGTGS